MSDSGYAHNRRLRTPLSAVLPRVRADCTNTQAAIDYALELSAVIEKYAQSPSPAEPETDTQQTDSIDANNIPDTDSQTQTEQSESCQQLENLLQASADELAKQVLQNRGEQLTATLTSHHSGSISSLAVAVEGHMA